MRGRVFFFSTKPFSFFFPPPSLFHSPPASFHAFFPQDQAKESVYIPPTRGLCSVFHYSKKNVRKKLKIVPSKNQKKTLLFLLRAAFILIASIDSFAVAPFFLRTDFILHIPLSVSCK